MTPLDNPMAAARMASRRIATGKWPACLPSSSRHSEASWSLRPAIHFASASSRSAKWRAAYRSSSSSNWGSMRRLRRAISSRASEVASGNPASENNLGGNAFTHMCWNLSCMSGSFRMPSDRWRSRSVRVSGGALFSHARVFCSHWRSISSPWSSGRSARACTGSSETAFIP